MRSFIINKLRVLLEASHTPSNPVMDKNYKKNITQGMINTMRAQIIQARKDYEQNPNAYGGTDDGEGVYVGRLSDNGTFRVGETGIGYQNKIGDYEDTKNGRVRLFYVRANRGMAHPEYDSPEKNFKTIGKSPAEDAKTKIMFFMGSAILDFMEDNAGYDDNKGEEIQKNKNTPEEIAKAEAKKAKADKLGAPITHDTNDYETEIDSKLRDIAIQRIDMIKGGDREGAAKLKGADKKYREEAKIIKRLKNLFRSNPDKIHAEIKAMNREDLYDKLYFLNRP